MILSVQETEYYAAIGSVIWELNKETLYEKIEEVSERKLDRSLETLLKSFYVSGYVDARAIDASHLTESGIAEVFKIKKLPAEAEERSENL